jgi:glyoxylase-like metal-dependent hydrolase (beta-lactamase superfamily II)
VAAEKVAPRIFRVVSVLGSRWLQQWIVKGDDGALLLDTGIAGETVPRHIGPALRAAGIEPGAPREVVISRADVDHYGGDAELRRVAPQARLRAHPLDRRLIESVERIERERRDLRVMRWRASQRHAPSRQACQIKPGPDHGLARTRGPRARFA